MGLNTKDLKLRGLNVWDIVDFSEVENIEQLKIPYSQQRPLACTQAEENIDSYLLTLYPNAKNIKYKKKIYRTLYMDKGECRIIVHIRKHNLKELLNADTKNN